MKFDSLIGALSAISFAIGLVLVFAKSSLSIIFAPPADNTAPQQASGDASRGEFIPPADNTAPQQSSGDASRGEFIPPADNTAPQQSSGGASRGEFTPPPDNVAPRQSSGGASRGEDENDVRSELSSLPAMVAVTPQSFYGTTLLDRPTFIVYLSASTAQNVIFSLQDEAGSLTYRTEILVPREDGIVSISLPAEAPELELNTNYQWFVTLKFDDLTPSSPFVDAWIKRIEPSPDLAESLSGEDLLTRAEVLAKNGVWYDSAALLTQLQLTQPDDSAIAQHWEELLESVSLHDLTDRPITMAKFPD